MRRGPEDFNQLWLIANGGYYAGITGFVLIWIAAGLTFVTGFDYFLKARPHLKDDT